MWIFSPHHARGVLTTSAAILLGSWVARQAFVQGEDVSFDPECVARICLAATALGLMAEPWQPELAVLIHRMEMRVAKTHERALSCCARFSQVFGRNARLVFVPGGQVPRVLALAGWHVGNAADGTPVCTSPLPQLHRALLAGIAAAPRVGSLTCALANLACYCAPAAWRDRRRTYIRA